jgi:hypothetical protein
MEYRMMMVSRQFKWSLYSPNDLIDLGTRLSNIAGEKVMEDPNGETTAKGLKAALGNLVIATERDNSNPVTMKIHDMDLVRDNDLFVIRDTIKTNTHKVKKTEDREAAKALLAVYNRHIGNVAHRGLAAESSAIKLLIESLLSDENKGKCELLGIVPLVEELGRTQAQFEALYVERVALVPELEKHTITNAMQETVNAVQAFLGFVDVMVNAGRDGYAEIRDKISHSIMDVETIARARITRIRNGEPEQTTSPEQPVQKAA